MMDLIYGVALFIVGLALGVIIIIVGLSEPIYCGDKPCGNTEVVYEHN